MKTPAHPLDRSCKTADRRDRLRGSISVLAICLPFLLSGCSLVDRTVDLVADLGDSLVGETRAKYPKRQAVETVSHAYSQPIVPSANPSGTNRRRVQTASLPQSEIRASDGSAGYRVIWDLGALPSAAAGADSGANSGADPERSPAPVKNPVRRAEDPANNLESRIAPAAGGAAVPPARTTGPTIVPSARSRNTTRNKRPLGAGQQAPAYRGALPPLAATVRSVKKLSIRFHPKEDELTERDKVHLSMLAWPHLEDEAVRVEVRSYLPTPEPGIGPAPVLQVHRGMNVRLYLTHLGLPNDRIDLTLVGTKDPEAPSHRVEVEVVGSDAPEQPPETTAARNKERAAQSDLERAAGLKAFHEALKAFTRQSPYAKSLNEAPADAAPESPPEPAPKATAKPRSLSHAAPLGAPGTAFSRQNASAKLLQPASLVRPVPDRTAPARTVQVVAVQLASLPDRADAEAEWRRIAGAHPDLLAGRHLDLQAVDLDGRGRYHRVRTGPLRGTSEATRLCEQLKTRGQDCLVVRSKRREAPQAAQQVASRAQ